MIIESLKLKSNRNPNVFEVIVNGQTFLLYSDVIVKYSIGIGKEIEKESFLKAVDESNYIICLNCATNYLGSRLRTSKQLKEYLRKKEFDKNIILKVIEKLNEYKVLNDEEYAKSFVKVNANKYSKRALEQKLMQKGVNKQNLEQSLEECDDKETCVMFANKFIKNKEINRQIIEKLIRHLQYKGFNFEDINYTLKKLKLNENY